MDINYLSQLPVEIFIREITYLPLSDVVSICQTSSKLHSYCTDSKYRLYWKILIDNTYNNIYGYQDKLNELWNKMGMEKETYNYIVYTQLIKTLPKITQLDIYYKQGDMKNFNDLRFSDYLRYNVILHNKYDMKEGDFYGIVKDNKFDIVTVKKGRLRSKSCQIYSKLDLVYLANTLQIPHNIHYNKSEYCDLIKEHFNSVGRLIDLNK